MQPFNDITAQLCLNLLLRSESLFIISPWDYILSEASRYGLYNKQYKRLKIMFLKDLKKNKEPQDIYGVVVMLKFRETTPIFKRYKLNDSGYLSMGFGYYIYMTKIYQTILESYFVKIDNDKINHVFNQLFPFNMYLPIKVFPMNDLFSIEAYMHKYEETGYKEKFKERYILKPHLYENGQVFQHCQIPIPSGTFIGGGYPAWIFEKTNKYSNVSMYIPFDEYIVDILERMVMDNNESLVPEKIWRFEHRATFTEDYYTRRVYSLNLNISSIKWLFTMNPNLKPIRIVLYEGKIQYENRLNNIYRNIMNVISSFDVPMSKAAIPLYNAHEKQRLITETWQGKTNNYDEKVCLPIDANCIYMPFESYHKPYRQMRWINAQMKDKYRNRTDDGQLIVEVPKLKSIAYEIVNNKHAQYSKL